MHNIIMPSCRPSFRKFPKGGKTSKYEDGGGGVGGGGGGKGICPCA